MVTLNSEGSHRFELLPEKRFVLHARHPDPWDKHQRDRPPDVCTRKPLGLVSKGPEG